MKSNILSQKKRKKERQKENESEGGREGETKKEVERKGRAEREEWMNEWMGNFSELKMTMIIWDWNYINEREIPFAYFNEHKEREVGNEREREVERDDVEGGKN